MTSWNPEAGLARPMHDHWVSAVTHAVESMTESLDESHSLCDISRGAFLSRFHFHRVFYAVTTCTPARFLTALRLAKAKRLLVETSTSCTDISIAVGYSSFGTFTSQFTRLVGLSPGKFRRYATQFADQPIGILPVDTAGQDGHGLEIGVSGRPDGLKAQVTVAVFSHERPQEKPVDCAVGWAPGRVRLGASAESSQIMALSTQPDATIGDLLCERPEAGLCVGRATAADSDVSIALRPKSVIDPPVLFAYPLAWAM